MKNNIIAVANWKGGCGKTLVSALLCHYLRMKEIPVMAIDADVQQSLFRQRMFELQGLPDAVVPWELQYLDTSDVDAVREQMKVLKNTPSCVVVDCPGNITDPGMVPVYEAADIIVVPFTCDFVNVDATFRFAQTVRKVSTITTNSIFISSAIEPSDPRYRFVLAHEYGHATLHRDILDNKIAVLYENEDSLKSLCASNNELKILERQANRFASYLLIPKVEFVRAVVELFVIYDIRGGYMYVDEQPCNLNDYHHVTSALSRRFLVSKQAVAYRMKDLGLLRLNEEDRLLIGL